MAWHPFRNFGLKFAALGLGTLLWFTVSGQQVERTVRAPVEYTNVPASLEISGDGTDGVLVHVRGSDSQISRIAPGDVRAVIDLRDTRPGPRVTIALRTDQVAVPFGVEVMRVDPPQVTITLEASGSRVVPIIPDVEGKLAAGYSLGPVKVEPDMIEVIGPASQLKLLDHATTARISVDGLAAGLSESVNITVPDAALRLREPKLARVTIAVVRTKDKNQ